MTTLTNAEREAWRVLAEGGRRLSDTDTLRLLDALDEAERELDIRIRPMHRPDTLTTDERLALEAAAWVQKAESRAEKAEAERDRFRARLGMVAGLLAAYGEAEGTPVDYEFLVSQISAAIGVRR